MFASAAMVRNPGSEVIPFDTRVHEANKARGESTLGFAERLSRCGGGGTNVSLVMDAILGKMVATPAWKPDHVIILSDMESWVDGSRRSWHGNSGTETLKKFRGIQSRGARNCKLVCWNLQASATTQAIGDDVLQVGGFSDELWGAVAAFLRGDKVQPVSEAQEKKPSVDSDTWLAEIESVPLDEAGLTAWVAEAKKGSAKVR